MDQFINLDPGAMRQSVPALVAGLMFVVLPIWYIYVWLVAKSLYQVVHYTLCAHVLAHTKVTIVSSMYLIQKIDV